jgi:hypothetical protein
VTDPLTRETTTARRPGSQRLPMRGTRCGITYDAWGFPETVTTRERGARSTDAAGRKLWEERRPRKRATYTYNARDQVLTKSRTALPYPRRRTTPGPEIHRDGRREPHDDLHVQRHEEPPLEDHGRENGVVEFTYSTAARADGVKDALGHTTTFTYDLMFGRKARRGRPEPRLEMDLQAERPPRGTIDALNRTTSFVRRGERPTAITYRPHGHADLRRRQEPPDDDGLGQDTPGVRRPEPRHLGDGRLRKLPSATATTKSEPPTTFVQNRRRSACAFDDANRMATSPTGTAASRATATTHPGGSGLHAADQRRRPTATTTPRAQRRLACEGRGDHRGARLCPTTM